MTALAGWENFYVIVGSSAGALIGLQFVVITLIAVFPIVKDVERASSAFATPTIVHFGMSAGCATKSPVTAEVASSSLVVPAIFFKNFCPVIVFRRESLEWPRLQSAYLAAAPGGSARRQVPPKCA
jgi:hypothetical protein